MTVYNRRKNFTVLFYRLLQPVEQKRRVEVGRKGGDKRRQLSDNLISGESQGHLRPGYNDTLILVIQVTRHNDGDNT